MDTSGRLRWLRTVLLLGVVYLVTGITFAALANGAGSHQMRVTWRLAAWVISAAAFAAHIGYEHVRRSEEHTSELQSLAYLVCRLLLEKKKKKILMTFIK